jgi:hypothetical protein
MSGEAKIIFEALYAKYKKVAISKKEMSLETGLSISTLDRQRRAGIGCNYIQQGQGDVFYPLLELAKYYTQTIQTL